VSLNAEYDAYLRSPAWAARRRVALNAAGHRFQVCNRNQSLDVHHRTYERFGNEDPSDLTVLCRPCHKTFHSTASVVARPRRKKRSAKAPRPATGKTLQLARLLEDRVPDGSYTTQEIADLVDLTPSSAGGRLGALAKHRYADSVRVKRVGKRWRVTTTGPKQATQVDLEALAAQMGARLRTKAVA
jgi:hypothetical protein